LIVLDVYNYAFIHCFGLMTYLVLIGCPAVV
jgi:hypothetical protein